jgi:hypothetical protein
MPPWLWPLILLLILSDVFVILFLLNRRARLALGGSGGDPRLDIARLRRLGEKAQERIVRHMESSYSGNVEDLPRALEGALAIARQIAQEELITLDDHGLRVMVTASVCGRHLAPRDAVVRALAKLPAQAGTG